MKRTEILDTAKELISGQRAKDYGDAFDNHSRIAEGWNIIVRGAILETIDHQDSWIDKAGYTALGGEFSERAEKGIRS